MTTIGHKQQYVHAADSGHSKVKVVYAAQLPPSIRRPRLPTPVKLQVLALLAAVAQFERAILKERPVEKPKPASRSEPGCTMLEN